MLRPPVLKGPVLAEVLRELATQPVVDGKALGGQELQERRDIGWQILGKDRRVRLAVSVAEHKVRR